MKVRERRERDEKAAREGKMDAQSVKRGAEHDAAFLYPVPFYVPVAGCVAVGMSGGEAASGEPLFSCSSVSDSIPNAHRLCLIVVPRDEFRAWLEDVAMALVDAGVVGVVVGAAEAVVAEAGAVEEATRPLVISSHSRFLWSMSSSMIPRSCCCTLCM